MNAPTADLLIDELRRLHLLEPDQLDELARSPGQFPTESKALAQTLIQRGWITPYQANRLLVGRGQELLLGSYVMLERLGEGGMGAVFKARNWKLGALRALKIIRKDRTAQPITVQRFQREMRAAAQLSHPNVVHAHDADEVDGVHYIAMELLSGVDLARRVADSGPLPVEQACDYVRQAALGLQHAHECGLVHRDIKPSNLLVTSAGVVKILDLGLARLAPSGEGSESSGTLTQPDSLMGTPDYMAPEQARHSHGVDGRADLYSLGATMYFLLTGQPPIPHGPLAATIAALLFNEPEPVENLRPDTPPAVGRLVRKLMAKKPEDRYQSGGEAAQDLAAFLAGKAGDSTVSYGVGGVSAPPAQPDIGGVDTVSGPITDPAPIAIRPAPKPAPRRVRPIYFAVALAVAILVFGTAALVKIVTNLPSAEPPAGPPKFTLRSDDSTVRVLLRLKGNSDALEARPNESVSLAAGEYDLELAPEMLPGLRLSQPVLKLKPGADETVRVEGFPLKADALVSRPAWIEGVRSWTIESHDKPLVLNPLAYSPNGRWIAGAATDGSIRLLDGRTGAPIRALTGHTGKVRALTWSSDGEKPMLASAGIDGSVRLWDPQAGSLPFRQNLDATVLAFAPDGKTLALGVELDIYLWNLANQKQELLPRKHTTAVRVLAWSPDGKTLSSGSTIHVQFWHAPDAAHREWTNDKLSGHTGVIEALAWSPDSATAASAGADGTVRLWDLSDLNKPARILAGLKGQVVGVTWMGDGDTIATTGADLSLRFWDRATGELRRMIPLGFNQGKFTPDGALQVGASPGWTARLTETLSGRPLGSVLVLPKGVVVLSEEGHYRCYADKPALEQTLADQLTYVVSTDQGPVKYTPVQFAAKFGWKNDPDRARLDTR